MKNAALSSFATMWILAVSTVLTGRAGTLVLDQNLFVGATDSSLENEEVVVSQGVTLTLAGVHRFKSLTVHGNLTHNQGDTNGVTLTVDGDVAISTTGMLDVTGKGYRGGRVPGNVFSGRGETWSPGGVAVAGSVPNAGGSYGSSGRGGEANAIYGSETAPVDLGSGGGSEVGIIWGGNGGGRMELRAHSLVVDGKLLANGNGSINTADGNRLMDRGGGSGGSIYVVLEGGTFGGTGVIEAKGGPSSDTNHDGGGGRIAIVGYQESTFSGRLGPAGTLFTQAAGSGGHLQLDGTSLTIATGLTRTYSSLSATANGGTIYNYGTLAMADDALVIGANLRIWQSRATIKGASRLDDSIGSVTVQSNGFLGHLQGETNGLQLKVAGLLKVEAGGLIDVTGQGYRGGRVPGNVFSGRGETWSPGGVAVAGSVPNAGGSYGSSGRGGEANAIYGSETAPVDLGSGGGSEVGIIWGGNGGGRMELRAHSLVVDGKLLANGNGSINTADGNRLMDRGGGSGGSIYVVLEGGTFGGTGVIESKGGPSSDTNHDGGGGRIAIVGYQESTFSGRLGPAATVFTQAAGSGGHLQLDGTSLTIATGSTRTYSALSATANGGTIYNYGTLAMADDALVIGANLRIWQSRATIKGASRLDDSIGSVTVQSNGFLGHLQGETNGLQLKVDGLLKVEAGGLIDVTGQGYRGGRVPGNPFGGRGETWSPGGVAVAGSVPNAGGSYGSSGRGGEANGVYGSETAPVDLGSGGGSEVGIIWGGNGGGRMELRAHSLVVDGKLLANGNGSINTADANRLMDRGGGSGGSIYVVLEGGTFGGMGVIEAKGGPSSDTNHDGGGGRIAIVGCFSKSFSGEMSKAGTIYLNRCPVLTAPGLQKVDEETELLVANQAQDEDLADVLTYRLLESPAGATISTSGSIRWLPSESDGPGTYTFTTVVRDNARVPLSATNSFTVVVNEVNVAPVLEDLANHELNAGETLSFRVSAHDVDLPANNLRYQLAAAPIGASISTEGRFTWRASVAQAGATHTFQIRVEDDGQPPRENSKSFMVVVAPLLPVTMAATPRPQSDGEFRFMIQGPLGPDYVVMLSDNLKDWTDVSTNLVPTLPFEFVAPIEAGIPQRFYRVRLQP